MIVLPLFHDLKGIEWFSFLLEYEFHKMNKSFEKGDVFFKDDGGG